MAIYHFSGTIISRSQGRSAVACAAYRSAESLYDERYQVQRDYTRKQDVVYKEVLLPERAPERLANRETLWNEVERAEKRKDSQLAREFNFSLPKELSLTQNIELARAFTLEQFVKRGMIADLAIHEDKGPEGESLPHAHVMLTMRELKPEGFGKKVIEWNTKGILMEWREAWAEFTNRYLALNGYDLTIDHRTLEAQGIPLEPQSKIGPVAAREAFSERVMEHERIARENGERLLEDPEIAFKALTHQQSTFTHHDLARFVNRHTDSPEQFTEVYETLKGYQDIVRLGVDDKGRERFTTKEVLALEQSIVDCSSLLCGDRAKTTNANDVLYAYTLTPEQEGVFHYLIEPEAIKAVIGYAGTGKSYLLGAAREAWEQAGYRIQGVTLSGIAAQSLEGASGIRSRTFASRCYYWNQDREKLGSRDVLVVDEAGMLGSRQMARIVSEVREAGAKLVLVGDNQQLQAIEAGAPFRAIVERVPFMELTEVRRQRIPWQQEATREFAKGFIGEAIHRYDAANHLHEYPTQALAREGLVALWNDVRLANSLQTQIMLAYTKIDVQELNQRARDLRRAQGELGEDMTFQTTRGERAFAENDRIYFLKNDRDLGVMNGTLGTIKQVKTGELWVCVDKSDIARHNQNGLIRVNLNFYSDLDHGYAATVHKSQGITVDRAYLLGSRYLDSHAAYVGMSRHRESVDLFWSREEFPKQQDLIYALSRDKSKDMSIDYVRDSFARTRGVDTGRNVEMDRCDQERNARNRDILKAFKEKFEAEHPEAAKRLQYEILPSAEKQAIQKQQAELAEKQAQALAKEKIIQTQQQKTIERMKELERGGFER